MGRRAEKEINVEASLP